MRAVARWVLVGGFALAACGSERASDVGLPDASMSVPSPTPSAPDDVPTEPSPGPDSSDDPAAMVARADQLFGVYVRRDGSTLASTSLWGVGCDHVECTPAVLVRRESRGAEPSYRVGTYDRLQRAIGPPLPPGPSDLASCATSVGGSTLCTRLDGSLTQTRDGGETWQDLPHPSGGRLMAMPLVALTSGIDAVVGGGDGATLFPFEQVARYWSWDDLSVYTVERPEGVTPYSSGTVVLSDGRILTPLADWSDDRPGRYSDRHHGLWVSDGEDWSTYAPVEPRFSPALELPGDGSSALVSLSASVDPDPVLWVQTWDHRVYVSTDDAASFTELRVR